MKSQSQTDSEILASAKSADHIGTKSQSTIQIRHTRSVHPVACHCLSCRELRFKPFSSGLERERFDELEWYRED